LCRQLLHVSYPARQRAIQFSGLQLFEVGPHMLLVAMHSGLTNLREIFRVHEMRDPCKWAERFIVNGELTVAGQEETKRFERNGLTAFLMRVLDPATFTAARLAFTRSYAASSFVHHVFGAHYPTLERVAVCSRTGEVPILCTDFDLECFTDNPEWSPVRLSPCIVATMGPSGGGEFSIALGAIGLALVANIETVRAFLEMVVSDMALETGPLAASALIAERTRLENKIIDICPPTNPDTSSAECLGWLNGITDLIEKAKRPEIQPVEAIPWY
jgi:hypothetical protein